jgi:hypothetical protein
VELPLALRLAVDRVPDGVARFHLSDDMSGYWRGVMPQRSGGRAASTGAISCRRVDSWPADAGGVRLGQRPVDGRGAGTDEPAVPSKAAGLAGETARLSPVVEAGASRASRTASFHGSRLRHRNIRLHPPRGPGRRDPVSRNPDLQAIEGLLRMQLQIIIS